MDKLVVTSLRPHAGKTSLIVGMSRALGCSIGYIKPFGERLLYRKKRLWDYDAALMTRVFDLEKNPEDISIGFHHSKLLYMLDAEATREKVQDLAGVVGEGKDLLFVEAGRDLMYGASVHLDALSLCRHLQAPLLLVVAGEEDLVLDDLAFVQSSLRMDDIPLAGIVCNKIGVPEDFEEIHLPRLREAGLPIRGFLPLQEALSQFSVSFLADRLFAKIIAGEKRLDQPVKSVFIASMAASAALEDPLFREPHKLVIASGDRSDMVLAACETGAAAILLTGNLLPPADILSQAEERQIPLLLVSADAYEVARQIEGMESLLTWSDAAKIDLLASLVKERLDLQGLVAGHPGSSSLPTAGGKSS